MAVVKGTPTNNTLGGTTGADTVYGSGGADIVTAGDGNDLVYGGYGGNLLLGTITYRFGGAAINNDQIQNTLALPDTLVSGSRFFVIVQDHVYTKAIQLEVQDLGNGDFTLRPIQGKYADQSVYAGMNGNFTAIQNYFNNNVVSTKAKLFIFATKEKAVSDFNK